MNKDDLNKSGLYELEAQDKENVKRPRNTQPEEVVNAANTLPENWLAGLNPNQVRVLPEDWNQNCAFLFAHLRSISPKLVFGYRSGKMELLFEDQQTLEKLKLALMEAINQCLGRGITSFIVLFTPETAFGVVASEQLLAMKHINCAIKIAALVDITHIEKNFLSNYNDHNIKKNLGRIEQIISEFDYILSFDKNAVHRCNLEKTYMNFCEHICRTVICYLSEKQMYRENLIKSCMNHRIQVINIYPYLNSGPFDHPYRYDTQYMEVKQKKLELTQELKNCTRNVVKYQSELMKIDQWILEYVSSQSYARGLAQREALMMDSEER